MVFIHYLQSQPLTKNFFSSNLSTIHENSVKTENNDNLFFSSSLQIGTSPVQVPPSLPYHCRHQKPSGLSPPKN